MLLKQAITNTTNNINENNINENDMEDDENNN